MKKTIILIILLVLIIPSVSMGQDNLRIQYLIDRGLVSGDADTGDLRLMETINRAEVAKMVVMSQGKEEIARSLKILQSPFIDMDSNNWANGYVNVAAVEGIIDGYPEKTFIPDNDITYAEVITIMVRILGGLEELDDENVSWEIPYIKKAMEIGILDDIEIIDVKEKAIREKVFEIVYNTIKVEEGRNYESYKGMVVRSISGLEVEIKKLDSEKNETEIIFIPRRLADPNSLLGMVIEVSKDSDNYVRDLSIDDSYTYIKGVPIFKEDSVLVNHRSYDISELEVYHNGKKYQYVDYYKEMTDAETGFTIETVRGTAIDKKLIYLDSHAANNTELVEETGVDTN